MKDSNGFRRENKKQYEPRDPNPVAVLLLNIIKDQITSFLTLPPEERFNGSQDLYYVGSYPAGLESENIPEASKYGVFQLGRAVRLPKDEPERMNRLSTEIILIDKETGTPAFFLTSYITPKMVANVRVVPYNEKGPVYREALSWDSRDEAKAAE